MRCHRQKKLRAGFLAGFVLVSLFPLFADDPPPAKIRSGPITDAEREFWSFQPVADPAPPPVTNEAWPKGDLDRFVLAKLEAAKLRPARAADKRTLLRRATFTLTGLPPTPDELAEFLADESPDAFSKVVERLLRSKAYGEHWGRHWLDIVRYADTAGETADFPVREAYLYRNWVIDSFNEDKPYDQFLREQLAGDILAEKAAAKDGDVSSDRLEGLITATGFIAISRRFGFDPENYHHLTIQDTIDTLGQSVLGLSLGCARCHDHKYDPVNMDDYYAWYGIFESTLYSYPGSESSKRPRDFTPAVPTTRAKELKQKFSAESQAIAAEIKRLDAERAKIAAELRPLDGVLEIEGEDGFSWNPFLSAIRARLFDDIVRNVDGHRGYDVWRPRGQALPLLGVSTADKVLEVPGTLAPGSVVVHPPARGGVAIAWRSPMAGKVRVSGIVSDAHDCGDSVTWHLDLLKPNGAVSLVSGAVGRNSRQELRAVADGSQLDGVAVSAGDFLQLAILPKSHYGCDLTSISMSIAELDGTKRVWKLSEDVVSDLGEGGKGNPHSDAHGHADVWFFYEVPEDRGLSWGAAKAPKDLAAAKKKARSLKTSLDQLTPKLAKLAARRAEMARGPYDLVYGVGEGQPKDAKIQERGDPKQLRDVVPRRNLRVFGNDPLPGDEQGSGRLQLASWLTRPENPLTARVMVNRIWQHHFGRGLVGTENDFGARGERPTHPELLDWLATRFVESGWSMKAMHRLIVMSAAYQQSSAYDARAGEIDPEARLIWRFQRRRLSAEEIRDSMLAISGNLDRSMGGAHPFPAVGTWNFTQHNPFYALYETNRRSVYLMQQRLKRHPFLALFDGADPNVSTARRILTTTPTQALFLMNDPFVHQQSQEFAERLMREAEGRGTRIRQAFLWTLARDPTVDEVQAAMSFQSSYLRRLQEAEGASSPRNPNDQKLAALAAFARTLMVRSEFLFVD